jgi:glucose-6-phosphate isomerase
MNVHFVANVDAADIDQVLKNLTPETTLICIASKTFTTQETMMNAKRARDWLGDLDIANHMIALSTNTDAVSEFGINPDNMFPFWDWVGGRFSVWSAIGMPIALAYGFDVFQDFLNGAKAMDDHFRHAELENNLPVILALYGIWNRNFMNRPAMAALPYAQNLSLFSNYLQQLDMESNGKSVDRDGHFITDYKTGPIVFGQAGTNGQHAFHQWLHQGADIVPCEFITLQKSHYNDHHQTVLNANAKAQAQAFDQGENNADLHRHYKGQRPSITLEIDELTPYSLGQLMALYEHKIFVQGVIWNINSFDQFGVELGKKLAKQILA